MKSFFPILLITLFWSYAKAQSDALFKTVEFPSLDGLTISANTYFMESEKPTILLCHQAGYNKAEYEDVAVELNKLGFSVMAIDQRSGGKVKGKRNLTHDRAKEEDKKTKYVDAEQDILAAINYAFKQSGKPIILWGSSYSAGLSLLIAPSNKKVAAVMAFSPGNYYGKAKPDIQEVLKDFSKPMFVSSSKIEAGKTKKLLSNLTLNDKQFFFKPSGLGKHGSSALWPSSSNNEEYWTAVKSFLSQF
jgi:alpha-beta hydrolase superfamily lysophospholipase